MPDDEFADVARQLEQTLSELNRVSDPALRRTLLSDMRRLIAEADRLAAEAAQPKWETKPTTVNGVDNRDPARCSSFIHESPVGDWAANKFSFHLHSRDIPVAFDREGNLYAAAAHGGGTGSNGLVFRLTPQLDGTWKEDVLHKFPWPSVGDGAAPYAGFILREEELFGTTLRGGASNVGAAVSISY